MDEWSYSPEKKNILSVRQEAKNTFVANFKNLAVTKNYSAQHNI